MCTGDQQRMGFETEAGNETGEVGGTGMSNLSLVGYQLTPQDVQMSGGPEVRMSRVYMYIAKTVEMCIAMKRAENLVTNNSLRHRFLTLCDTTCTCTDTITEDGRQKKERSNAIAGIYPS
jgi:hypothetical protein